MIQRDPDREFGGPLGRELAGEAPARWFLSDAANAPKESPKSGRAPTKQFGAFGGADPDFFRKKDPAARGGFCFIVIWDTNVGSGLIKAQPDAGAAGWVKNQSGGELRTTSIATVEVFDGIARLPSGPRRKSLTRVGADVFDSRVGLKHSRIVIECEYTRLRSMDSMLRSR